MHMSKKFSGRSMIGRRAVLASLLRGLSFTACLVAAASSHAQQRDELCAAQSAGSQDGAGSGGSGSVSVRVNIAGDSFRGSAEAPVTLIEYGDYQCSFCGKFKRDIYSRLDADYIQTSRLRYIYRDLPLKSHEFALHAARAALCAKEQGKYWEMHERIFALEQSFSETELQEQAQALGLRMQNFRACVEDARSEAMIRRGIEEAGKMQIAATPTFVVGTGEPGENWINVSAIIVGIKTLAEYRSIIDRLLADGDRLSKCTTSARNASVAR